MSRPQKCRRVCFLPGVTYFKPAGIPLRVLEENQLLLEEIEAIRLKDSEHLKQEECAKKMGISRPTFQRILALARKKIADSIINGKALRIEGGNYKLATGCFTCRFGHKWDTSAGSSHNPGHCPICEKANTATTFTGKELLNKTKSPTEKEIHS